jgi:hypothetical protein
MSAVMTGASSFETARSAPPQDEEEDAANAASGPHPEEGRRPVSKGEARSDRHTVRSPHRGEAERRRRVRL